MVLGSEKDSKQQQFSIISVTPRVCFAGLKAPLSRH